MEATAITGVFPRGDKFYILYKGEELSSLEFESRDVAWKTLIRFQYLMSRQGELLEQIQKDTMRRLNATSSSRN